MEQREIQQFQETVWNYYHAHGRNLPWRHEPFDPYHILVSEIMLQQTQVSRVIPKYTEFLTLFPTLGASAQAPLADVIKAWSGLGYNRRAKYLHDASSQLRDKITWTMDDLTACKGIGFNTAAAVITYAYNQPIAFIETNIRTVYISHFFEGSDDVHDKEILERVAATLDTEHAREFMWALMDYGSYLKAGSGNASRRSKHYAKQSAFHGSKRQIRGQVLRLLGSGSFAAVQLARSIEDERLAVVLGDLEKEGLINRQGNTYFLGI